MNSPASLAPRQADEKLNSIIKLAVLAVGGQGGGVLTSWIETMARAQGYACQATSVAGVAQRTGATIYYVEMAPAGTASPIFSLAPAPGDVDILIAAEMMEAGRAILRGFVTPDRTTLIASTHRTLAVSEKMVPGDGIASSDEVRAAAEIAAEHLIMFEMDQLALNNGSVISSTLFGALAASNALPFPREAFEQAIRASGKSVDTSLQAFAAGFAKAGSKTPDVSEDASVGPRSSLIAPHGPGGQMREWNELVQRVQTLPNQVSDMTLRGLRKVVGFQDVAYGREYLDRLDDFIALDHTDKNYTLSVAAAKHLSNAMAYDDMIRVADLKTRGTRFARIEAEMNVGDKTLHLTEFMHPRAEEIAGMLPKSLGLRVEGNPKWMARLDRWFNKGRRVRTHRVSAFVMLYVLGGLRGYRRKTLRHKYEQDHLQRWLDICLSDVTRNYEYAVELVNCRRLIKGYSDTHARGLSKFDRVIEGAEMVRKRDDAAEWVERLRTAALQDEKGTALDGALCTIRSFTSPSRASGADAR